MPPIWAEVIDTPVVRNPLPNPHFQWLLSFPRALPAPLNHGSDHLGGARGTPSCPPPAQLQRQFLLCPEIFRKQPSPQLEGSSTPLSPHRWVPEPLPLFLALKVLHGPRAPHCPLTAPLGWPSSHSFPCLQWPSQAKPHSRPLPKGFSHPASWFNPRAAFAGASDLGLAGRVGRERGGQGV